jgi:predicted adenine nucleotide alpha hydrolase (AANH) superfamily ATPase
LSGHRPTAFFFNPNIHPYREFERRLEAMKLFARSEALDLLIDDRYDLRSLLEKMLRSPEKPERCLSCYRLRLGETARTCREGAFDAFSTTLLVSPYQYHDLVRKAGEEAAADHGVRFLYNDFRNGWAETIATAREKRLYRQGYCGCIFSEVERYRGRRRVE